MTADIIRFTPDDVQEPWPEPHPLAAITAGQDYPLDSLPLLLRDAVLEVRQFIQAPTALAACCALSALSLSVQGLVDVRRASGIAGPTSLFMLALADSGERKSAVDAVLMQSIKQFEREQAEAAKPAMVAYKSDHDAWEAKRRGILDSIKQLAKSSEDISSAKYDLGEHDTLEPTSPLVPKLVMQDITAAALVHSLGTRWPSSGIVSPEAGAMFGGHSLSADEIMKTLSLHNSLWSGESVDIVRRSSESFTVRGARMTIGIAIQPATLKVFLQKNGPLARGTGWLSRMLVAIPSSTQGYRLFKEPPADWPRVSKFNERLLELLRLPMPLISNACELNPLLLDFDTEAKAYWVALHDEFEVALRKGGELADLRDSASKAGENAARIAAIFHVLENGTVGAIGIDNVERAGALVAWHLSEAARMASSMAITSQAIDAVELDEWLIKRCKLTAKSSVSTREVLQCGPGRLRTRATLDVVLLELIDARRVRVGEYGRRRLIHVNPELLGV